MGCTNLLTGIDNGFIESPSFAERMRRINSMLDLRGFPLNVDEVDCRNEMVALCENSFIFKKERVGYITFLSVHVPTAKDFEKAKSLFECTNEGVYSDEFTFDKKVFYIKQGNVILILDYTVHLKKPNLPLLLKELQICYKSNKPCPYNCSGLCRDSC